MFHQFGESGRRDLLLRNENGFNAFVDMLSLVPDLAGKLTENARNQEPPGDQKEIVAQYREFVRRGFRNSGNPKLACDFTAKERKVLPC